MSEYYKEGTYFEEHGRPDPRDQDLPTLPARFENWDEVAELEPEEIADIAIEEGWDEDEAYLVEERCKPHVYEDINSDCSNPDKEQFEYEEYDDNKLYESQNMEIPYAE